MRLVRHLYGEKTYPVPPRGSKPDWVLQPTVISPIVSGSLYSISNTTDEAVIKSEIKKALSSVKDKIFSISLSGEETQVFQTDQQKYIDFLDTFRPYRDAAVTVLGNLVHKQYFEDIAADFFEEYKLKQNETNSLNTFKSQATCALLHEIFIYTITLLWEAEEYAKIRDLITRTYFVGGKYRSTTTFTIIDVIYSGGYVNLIENAKSIIDKKKYYSGLAQLWTEHIISGFSLDQVTFADLLIYNLSILVEPEGTSHWFPMLYVYGLENPVFERFSAKMRSARHIKRIQGLFSDSSPVSISERMQNMSNIQAKDRYRYNNAFDRAPLILDYVKTEEIGKLQ